jgi:hypothetical protein
MHGDEKIGLAGGAQRSTQSAMQSSMKSWWIQMWDFDHHQGTLTFSALITNCL